MPHQMSAEMQACMDVCHHCHVTCLSMVTQHCLVVGGAHAAPEHIKIMLDCAQICATSLDFMARGSDQHKLVCGICAQICRACAESCRGLDGMEDCVAACERCAQECEKMAA